MLGKVRGYCSSQGTQALMRLGASCFEEWQHVRKRSKLCLDRQCHVLRSITQTACGIQRAVVCAWADVVHLRRQEGKAAARNARLEQECALWKQQSTQMREKLLNAGTRLVAKPGDVLRCACLEAWHALASVAREAKRAKQLMVAKGRRAIVRDQTELIVHCFSQWAHLAAQAAYVHMCEERQANLVAECRAADAKAAARRQRAAVGSAINQHYDQALRQSCKLCFFFWLNVTRQNKCAQQQKRKWRTQAHGAVGRLGRKLAWLQVSRQFAAWSALACLMTHVRYTRRRHEHGLVRHRSYMIRMRGHVLAQRALYGWCALCQEFKSVIKLDRFLGSQSEPPRVELERRQSGRPSSARATFRTTTRIQEDPSDRRLDAAAPVTLTFSAANTPQLDRIESADDQIRVVWTESAVPGFGVMPHPVGHSGWGTWAKPQSHELVVTTETEP